MKLFSYRNDLVLDPFNGVGTTTAVAWKLRRRFIGIDVSRQYSESALRRLSALSAGETVSETYPEPELFDLGT